MLGTAQLGSDYGVANRTGRPDAREAANILKRAWQSGIRLLDTARAYGDSETVIGRFIAGNPDCAFGVVSKLDVETDLADASAVATATRASCDRIGRRLEGLLLHDSAPLARLGDGIRDALARCVESGLAAAVGVSVYTPEEFEIALADDIIGIIQAPFNVLDRRVRDQGLIGRAAVQGKRVFLRSAYLQGLLLMEPAALPPAMRFAAATVGRWRALCADHGMGPLEAALGFVRAAAPEARIVVGCDNEAQLAETVAAARTDLPDAAFLAAIEALGADDPRIIDPRTWH